MASVVALAQARASALASHPWLRRLIYPTVFAACFVLFLFLTFPFDDLARSLEAKVRESGGELTIERMRPSGLGGVAAFGVKLRMPLAPGADPLPELTLDRVDARPEYLLLLLRRLAFTFSAEGYGGKGSGRAALAKDVRQGLLEALAFTGADLDLQRLPIRELSGLEVAGRANFKVDLHKLSPLDLATGTVSATIKGAFVEGKLTSVSMMPTLPKTALGEVELQGTLDKGAAKIDKCWARNGDLDAEVDGTLRLKPLFSLSQADGHVRFKLSEAWLNQNPVYRGLLTAISAARQGDGNYVYTLAGPLSSITARPGR